MLGGYNHKMKVLLERAVMHMKSFASTLDNGSSSDDETTTQVSGKKNDPIKIVI